MIIITIIATLAIGIGSFYGLRKAVKLYTGCNNAEADKKIQDFFNGRTPYSLENDIGFVDDIWSNIHNIIGDKRFNQLVNLSKTAITTPLISLGFNGGLPYIAVSVYFEDQNEQQVIENTTVNLVSMYLQRYGYNSVDLLVNWKTRYDLKMPYLEIRYARNAQEQQIINNCLINQRQDIITMNTPVIDTNDEEDLNE